jgi:hypothetical protein
MKKRISKSMNMYVIFGLLAVLFISLGYLSMQTGREGFVEGAEGADTPTATITLPISSDAPTPVGTKKTIAIQQQPFKVREGLDTGKMLTPPKKDDKKEGFFGFNMN